ncbi:MAG TPA: hypothetical protein VJB99_03450 [Patescibacteria group bacterium]|nr:hypothetical protein [Patescibacteria group bacterium]
MSFFREELPRDLLRKEAQGRKRALESEKSVGVAAVRQKRRSGEITEIEARRGIVEARRNAEARAAEAEQHQREGDRFSVEDVFIFSPPLESARCGDLLTVEWQTDGGDAKSLQDIVGVSGIEIRLGSRGEGIFFDASTHSVRIPPDFWSKGKDQSRMRFLIDQLVYASLDQGESVATKKSGEAAPGPSREMISKIKVRNSTRRMLMEFLQGEPPAWRLDYGDLDRFNLLKKQYRESAKAARDISLSRRKAVWTSVRDQTGFPLPEAIEREKAYESQFLENEEAFLRETEGITRTSELIHLRRLKREIQWSDRWWDKPARAGLETTERITNQGLGTVLEMIALPFFALAGATKFLLGQAANLTDSLLAGLQDFFQDFATGKYGIKWLTPAFKWLKGKSLAEEKAERKKAENEAVSKNVKKAG